MPILLWFAGYAAMLRFFVPRMRDRAKVSSELRSMVMGRVVEAFKAEGADVWFESPPERFLGILGVTGMTAYFGLLEVGQPKPGETVVVSGAANASCPPGQEKRRIRASDSE